MATTTYLDHIVASFVAVGALINEALEDEGLAQLTDWFTGQPKGEPREVGTPYGWFELVDESDVSADLTELACGQLRTLVMVVLGLAAPTPDGLVGQLAAYAPHVAAAIERGLPAVGLRYQVNLTNVSPGPRVTRQGCFRLVGLLFEVVADREPGEVS